MIKILINEKYSRQSRSIERSSTPVLIIAFHALSTSIIAKFAC